MELTRSLTRRTEAGKEMRGAHRSRRAALPNGEVEAARNAGARTVTLGKRILRTETAGLFVLSAVGLLSED